MDIVKKKGNQMNQNIQSWAQIYVRDGKTPDELRKVGNSWPVNSSPWRIANEIADEMSRIMKEESNV